MGVLTDSDVVPWVSGRGRHSGEQVGISGPVTTETLLHIGFVAEETDHSRVADDSNLSGRRKATEAICTGKKSQTRKVLLK